MISLKNVILPNKPLSNFELEDAVKKLKIPCFRGVFLLDTLPKKNVELLILIKVVGMELTGSLGIKTVKLKSTLIVMVFNRLLKL